MKNLMIDGETIATTGLPIFIQLGACVFDDEAGTVGEGFQLNISVDSCVKFGAVVDQGAFEFWLLQPEAARRSVIAKPRVTIEHALGWLQTFYALHGPERVWSQGLTFDVSHLERYFERVGWAAPWRYSAPRDTRTLYELAERFGDWERPTRETAHTALADARAQAQDCLDAMRALRRPTPAPGVLDWDKPVEQDPLTGVWRNAGRPGQSVPPRRLDYF